MFLVDKIQSAQFARTVVILYNALHYIKYL